LHVRRRIGAAFGEGHDVIANRGDADAAGAFTHDTERVRVEQRPPQSLQPSAADTHDRELVLPGGTTVRGTTDTTAGRTGARRGHRHR
jgi:hypothetical protein